MISYRKADILDRFKKKKQPDDIAPEPKRGDTVRVHKNYRDHDGRGFTGVISDMYNAHGKGADAASLHKVYIIRHRRAEDLSGETLTHVTRDKFDVVNPVDDGVEGGK